jgi:hypothetical protein
MRGEGEEYPISNTEYPREMRLEDNFAQRRKYVEITQRTEKLPF